MEIKKEMYECPEAEELKLAMESAILSVESLENLDDTEEEIVI